MCRKVDESIYHIVCGCSKPEEKEYKRRHDNLGITVHWKLAKKCNFEAGDKWCEHEPENVLENEDLVEFKILWNFSIQTDHVIGAIPKQFGNRLKQIGITGGTTQFQKTILLGTARLLRKVLEI